MYFCQTPIICKSECFSHNVLLYCCEPLCSFFQIKFRGQEDGRGHQRFPEVGLGHSLLISLSCQMFCHQSQNTRVSCKLTTTVTKFLRHQIQSNARRPAEINGGGRNPKLLILRYWHCYFK